MIIQKTYNGNLNIEQNKISVDTSYQYIGIEIQYTGKINIQSLMPNGWTYHNNLLASRITIKKDSESSTKLSDLFKYRGKAIITKCSLILDVGRTINLSINRSNLELWNTLRKTSTLGTTDGVAQDWAYLTKNWEDISFDGNNAKRPYIYRKTTYDKETNTFNTITEIRKKNYG